MMGSSQDPKTEPVFHPRLVGRLKNRRRLIDFGFREEFLDELEDVIAESRTPDNLAEKAVKATSERTQRATARVVSSSLERGNETILRDL